MGQIKDPGNTYIGTDDGEKSMALKDHQKTLERRSAGGRASGELLRGDKPRPSEVFDWDKALELNRQTRREIYGA